MNLYEFVVLKRGKLDTHHGIYIEVSVGLHPCTIKRNLITISVSCVPEPGKCPGKPVIALPDQTYGPI